MEQLFSEKFKNNKLKRRKIFEIRNFRLKDEIKDETNNI